MMQVAVCLQPVPIGVLGKYTMPLFIVDEIREITSARLLTEWEARAAKQGIRRLCMDSREIGEGDLFVAIKGERMDGHDFVLAALKKGAVGARPPASMACMPLAASILSSSQIVPR